ncbi:MAG: WbqC family protein [Prevotella sp.]|nr:WbqC family protein [Prevotella sp.]
MNALLSMTYFGPVQWYQKLHRHQTVFIEQHDSYVKQTYRNRCIIATANGQQALTVPVERTANISDTAVADTSDATTDTCASCNDIRISDHGNWRHLHWHALMSAYSETPFFEYYADDIRPFFEQRWDRLYDFDMAICRRMCELLDIRPDIRLTTEYVRADDVTPASGLLDLRDTINPKHPLPDTDFTPRRYYQVFERKHGFQSNLSILDLLFNMGPESILYL